MKSNQSDFMVAKVKAAKARKLVQGSMAARYGSDRGLVLDLEIRAMVPSGFYEHFKSTKRKPMYYFVHEVGEQVNYREVAHRYQVNYVAQYGPKKGRHALRELLGPDGFLTPIKRTRYTGPRFRYVGPTRPRT